MNSPGPSAPAADDPVSILLVDDQPARLLSYEAILESLGHRLVHARSGEECLERLMQGDFAAILLDINMPGMDGFETATLIHQHPRFENTPIIFVTAVHVTDLDRLKGYTVGAVDYVYVPVVPEILRGKVRVLVELYRQRRELERLNRQLADANTELADANAELRAEKSRELQLLNASLAGANAELEQTNAALQIEIEQRILAQSALEEADRRKDDFLAMLSHELRNPLAAMQGAIELMHRKTVEDRDLAWARSVLARQNSHLSRLIEDLLDVSRITRGSLVLERRPVDLREVVEHALEATHPAVVERRHTLDCVLPRTPLRVMGDHVRLTQVLTNLLGNAAKYTPPGGRLRVVLDDAEDALSGSRAAALHVEDNGRGIDPSALPRLFEPVSHAERIACGPHDGLGIGLTVVRGLVEMHGGRTEAHSEGEGRGSRFSIYLPLHESIMESTTTAADPRETAPAPASPLRILVVDDNHDSAESMSLLLQCDGHDVTTAYSGEAALALVETVRPEAILLDIGMPGMMGYEVAQRLRSRASQPAPLLIAVTGYGRDSDVERARAAGFDHHLVKPVDYARLRALLAACGGTATGAEAAGPDRTASSLR